jgi:hypothetical protein
MDDFSKQEKYMQKEFDKYFEIITEYAKQEFNKNVLPYVKKYSLIFLSGNGTYYIGYTKNAPKWFINKYKNWSGNDEDSEWEGQINRDKLPIKLLYSLNSVIPAYDYCLGSIMPNYQPEKSE